MTTSGPVLYKHHFILQYTVSAASTDVNRTGRKLNCNVIYNDMSLSDISVNFTSFFYRLKEHPEYPYGDPY
jgi:hypothetical protein